MTNKGTNGTEHVQDNTQEMLFDNKTMYTTTQASRIWGVTQRTIMNYCAKYPELIATGTRRGRKLFLSGRTLNRIYYGIDLATTQDAQQAQAQTPATAHTEPDEPQDTQGSLMKTLQRIQQQRKMQETTDDDADDEYMDADEQEETDDDADAKEVQPSQAFDVLREMRQHRARKRQGTDE